MSTTSSSFVVVSSSTVATPLLSAGVVTTSAPMMLSPPSLAPSVPPFAVLATAVPSSSSRSHFSLDQLYTSSDANSLYSANYKLEQKTPVSFVSAFYRNLIWSAGVQNAMDSTKVFLQRSLVIQEENGQWHQETVQKVASLEAEVTKWRPIAHTVWRQEHPKVANATIADVSLFSHIS